MRSVPRSSSASGMRSSGPWIPASSSPANAKDALQFNLKFWADQGEELEKRFASWAAQ